MTFQIEKWEWLDGGWKDRGADEYPTHREAMRVWDKTKPYPLGLCRLIEYRDDGRSFPIAGKRGESIQPSTEPPHARSAWRVIHG